MKRVVLVWTAIILAVNAWCQTTTQYVNVNSLNIRATNSTQAEIIGKLSKGQSVEVIEVSEAWTKITVNGKTGYVATRYLIAEKPTTIKKAPTVLICGSSSSVAYHRYECRGLARCRSGVDRVSVNAAGQMGYRACKICY